MREKVALMAHMPCQTSPRGFVAQSEEHPFTIRATDADDFPEVPPSDCWMQPHAQRLCVAPQKKSCTAESISHCSLALQFGAVSFHLLINEVHKL